MAEYGFPSSMIDYNYIERSMPALEPLECHGLACALWNLTSLRSGLKAEVSDRLAGGGGDAVGCCRSRAGGARAHCRHTDIPVRLDGTGYGKC